MTPPATTTRLSHAVACGQLPREEAARLLVAASRGGLTRVGAAHVVGWDGDDMGPEPAPHRTRNET